MFKYRTTSNWYSECEKRIVHILKLHFIITTAQRMQATNKTLFKRQLDPGFIL